jgi:hypothetical protein
MRRREVDIISNMNKKHESVDKQNMEKAGMEHAPSTSALK